MKKSKIELKKIARQIIKTNLVVWQAIYLVEEFYVDKLHLLDDDTLDELAKIMINLKNGTEQMADPYFNSLYFQEFEYFGQELQGYLDKHEKSLKG